MEKNLRKIGVMFLVIVEIMFGSLVGLFSRSLLVQILTVVVIVACIFIGHFLITRKLNQITKRKPIEVIILLFADIVFGMFAGSTLGYTNPTIFLLSAVLVALCGFIAFFILFLKAPESDAFIES